MSGAPCGTTFHAVTLAVFPVGFFTRTYVTTWLLVSVSEAHFSPQVPKTRLDVREARSGTIAFATPPACASVTRYSAGFEQTPVKLLHSQVALHVRAVTLEMHPAVTQAAAPALFKLRRSP